MNVTTNTQKLLAFAVALASLQLQCLEPFPVPPSVPGANAPMSAPVTEGRTFSGVFLAAITGRTTRVVLDQAEEDFFAQVNTYASEGFHLIDVDMKPVEGSEQPRWSGVFESGLGQDTKLLVLAKSDFEAQATALRDLNFDIVDLESYQQESTGTIKYVGLFRPGTGDQVFSLGMNSWAEVSDTSNELKQLHNLHLTNIEHHEEGSQNKFGGVWTKYPPGNTSSESEIAGWNQLADAIQTKAARGLRLLDMEATTWHMIRSGKSIHERGYLGAWAPGSDKYEVVAATTQDVFLRKVAELEAQGLRPVHIEMEEGYMPPVGLAANFAKQMDGHVAGYSYAIAEAGQVTAQGGFGYARPLWATHPYGPMPMSADTRLDMGSVSKSFTAAAMLRLRDQGKLGAMGIDQSFLKGPYLNGGTLGDATNIGTAVDTITIRHLLMMKSGITWDNCTDPDWYNKFVSQDVSASTPPGSDPAKYNGTNTCVLRKIIEHVSGKPFEQYLQEDLLDLMGISSMDGITCKPSPTWLEARYYFYDELSGNGAVSQPYDNWASRYCGAGGLLGSADQILRFLMALRTTSVLSQTSLNDFRSGLMNGAGWIPSRFGRYYGKNGGAGWYTGSVGGGLAAVIGMAPQDTQVVIMANTAKRDGDFVTTTMVNGVVDMQSMPVGMYRLQATDAGRCITANEANGSMDAAKVTLAPCGGDVASSQAFIQRKRRWDPLGTTEFSQLQSADVGLCFSAREGKLADCNAGWDNLEFHVIQTGIPEQVTLLRKGVDLCLGHNGDDIDQQTCTGASNQIWRMTSVAP